MIFSLPLKSGSDSLDVCQRELAADFRRDKLLNQFTAAYRRAPYFEQTYFLLDQIVRHDQANLFRYLHHSIVRTCEHLGIDTSIRVSSGIAIDHGLKGQDKVLALCTALGASTYVNAIGGIGLYSHEAFRERDLDLRFIRSKPFEYPQLGDTFVPWLSIIDVLMFNPLDAVQACVASNHELI